jgi:hypothetical protein
MSKIIITKDQVRSIENILLKLKNDRDVKEFEVMYNPIVQDILMIRYKRYSTTEDGGIKLNIEYHCVDRKGMISDCHENFGKEFYYALRDYQTIQLNNPSIEVI